MTQKKIPPKVNHYVPNLDRIAKERGLGAYDISMLTGLRVPTVYLLLKNDGRYSPTLRTLSTLAVKLGLELSQVVRME